MSPETTISTPTTPSQRRERLLRGYGVHLQTFGGPGELALSYNPAMDLKPRGRRPDLWELHQLLAVVQQVFPEQFVTSNRAETFNSVHDRQLSYGGRITLEQANEKLYAWQCLIYYPLGTQKFLQLRVPKLPRSLLTQTFHLAFHTTIFS